VKDVENQHRQIHGYRELDERDIAIINAIKAKAQEVGALVEHVKHTHGSDIRWASIAQTELQQGFMALIRAVAKPATF